MYETEQGTTTAYQGFISKRGFTHYDLQLEFIALNVMFQIYNAGHQFMLSNNRLSANVIYWVCAVFISFSVLYYLAMHKVQNAALDNCRELEEQYQFTVGS
ncbi:hypothetical protein HQ865_17280 [Mucilaginibacter mali]|uniref:Uncharacterized protein n=1 Tax=Mucilaginibacter mali TaxID=2740462 RepID=A0A7D4QD42_9SPHI|nr:hypothetical protein [Mucilaginibacter mali]QKJ31444.1 hypothetical protein HQ865_17280 [Mucilaginibacter mali]